MNFDRLKEKLKSLRMQRNMMFPAPQAEERERIKKVLWETVP
jgi:hypothetical protein